jgi:hypothetical protein
MHPGAMKSGSRPNPVRIQSAPILPLAPLFASRRDPVGIHSGINFAVFLAPLFDLSGKQLKKHPQTWQNVRKMLLFFMNLVASRQVPDNAK